MITYRRAFLASALALPATAACSGLPAASASKGSPNPNYAKLGEILTAPVLKTEDGVVTVPTGPGSGIEIDPAFIAKHTVVQGPVPS
jgi:L-alanine-DL-glutamate epimerase-like enolase superfamily enzyme